MPACSGWGPTVLQSEVAPGYITLAALPPGRWGVGVSGGADSVALLRLLLEAGRHAVAVVHLDHQTRGEASTADAAFVAELAGRLGVPCEAFALDQVEAPRGPAAKNPSARYRLARLACYRQVVARHGLAGVALAHHADDQAETVLLRLVRGGSAAGLAGMAADATVAGVRLVRPALAVRRDALRAYLRSADQPWREDASNASPVYARNRARRLLAGNERLTAALLTVAAAARRWAEWLDAAAPVLGDSFAAAALAALPPPLAERSARRWLASRGVPADAVSPAVAARLVAMAADAASAPRLDFPGRLTVRRRRGTIWVSVGGRGWDAVAAGENYDAGSE